MTKKKKTTYEEAVSLLTDRKYEDFKNMKIERLKARINDTQQGKFKEFIFWLIRKTEKDKKIELEGEDFIEISSLVSRATLKEWVTYMKDSNFMVILNGKYKLTTYFWEVLKSEEISESLKSQLENEKR
jgi:hypothetical protein